MSDGIWIEDMSERDGPPAFGFRGVRHSIAFDDSGKFLVGRDASKVHLVIPNSATGRQQAGFERRDGDVVVLVDYGSGNRTHVNNEPVDREHVLRDGDLISFGDPARRVRFRRGDVDDVVGPCFSIGERVFFAQTWPSLHHFSTVALQNGDVAVRSATFMSAYDARAARLQVLWSERSWSIVDAPDDDGPTLTRIVRASNAAGGAVDAEVLGIIAAHLWRRVDSFDDIVIAWNGAVVVPPPPPSSSTSPRLTAGTPTPTPRGAFAALARNHGLAVADVALRTTQQHADADRALLGGLVGALFPSEAKRSRERREQIALRGLDAWRDALVKWAIR